MSAFRTPAGMKTELFAAEPLLANPVAFCIDERGRMYVCETFRQQKGVEDNRGHMNWLHDDLAAQSVEDRLKFFKKHLGKNVNKYAQHDDRIRVIWDSNADGKADKASVFADGFNGIVEGTGAGVLARYGHVYYTNIPSLWHFRDKNGDGKADSRTALHSGYGVRVAFRGHDMHGLTIGPDGRLYFSIGDRGYNVVTQEGKRLKRPDTGAVFRCELDGSKLEVFAYGLRNPQELAFDDYGNLFTGDNNSDSGDRARWVHVVEGGDTGWRMYYQYLPDRGPWNREMIWYPHDEPALKRRGPGNVPRGTLARDVQPAYTIPPVANLADGPSGLVAYPGVGLPDRYKGHFFLADFRGNSGRSGIRSFAVKPKGASFELTDSHQFVWKVLATDVDFGYDGAMYVSDWVDGWNGPGKGRIYRFAYPEHAKKARDAKIAELMRKGFLHRATSELVQLLSHPDRRIRQEAQFALVTKKDGSELSTIAADKSQPLLPRLHAIWGLGQLLRTGKADAGKALNALLYRQDDEILAQAARAFGDGIDLSKKSDQHCLQAGGRARLRKLLSHKSPRVRSFAAIALGRVGRTTSVKTLAAVLSENADKDPVLRHAAVMGLTGVAGRHSGALATLASSPNKSVRMGVLLAMRRLRDNDIARFLNDVEPSLALEAARAINDEPFDGVTGSLAKLAGRPGLSDPLLRRVMHANFRLGGADNAAAVARVAADSRVAERLRSEALFQLHNWNSPTPLDRVTGAWRPIQRGKAIDVAAVIRPYLGGIFAGSSRVRQAGAKLAAKYGITEVGPLLFGMLSDRKQSTSVRVASLRALAELKHTRTPDAIALALKDSAAEVRAQGLTLLAARDPEKAVPLLDAAIKSGQLVEQQSAIAVLPSLKTKDADAALARWMEALIARKAPAGIQLDLLEAAKARKQRRFSKFLARYEATRSKTDPLAHFRESLAGGNAARGREIFFGRDAVSCRRCHKIAGEGGEVGPDLSGIGKQKKRDYLLESLVLPNKTIAKGFDSVVLAMNTGKVYSGIVKSTDGKTIRLMQATGELITLKVKDIDFRNKGKSAMPGDLVKHLSKADVRDLVEYLSTLKQPVKKP